MASFWRGAPIIAALARLQKLLGIPLRIELSFTHGLHGDAKIVFDLEGAAAAAAGRWLVEHGFTGDRQHGWTRVPGRGPRAIVEVSREELVDVVVRQVVEPR